MTPRKKIVNPFYVLVVIVGVVFTVTACAYGVMTVRGLRPELSADGSGEGLMTFLDQHGFRLMLIELGVLAVCSVAAMVTDAMWSASFEVGDRTNGTGGNYLSNTAHSSQESHTSHDLPATPKDSPKANESVPS